MGVMPSPRNTSFIKGVHTAHNKGKDAAIDGIPRYSEDDLENREAVRRLSAETTNLPMCKLFILPDGQG